MIYCTYLCFRKTLLKVRLFLFLNVLFKSISYNTLKIRLFGVLTNTHKELRNIMDWMRINKPSANPKRTEYMIIGHLRRTNKVKISEPLNLKGAVWDFCKQTDFAGQCAFSINEINDQWRTVITQLRCSRQIEIDAVIGSSVSNFSWMNFDTMLLVLTKTNNLIQVK